jgi:hypothetical protein
VGTESFRDPLAGARVAGELQGLSARSGAGRAAALPAMPA